MSHNSKVSDTAFVTSLLELTLFLQYTSDNLFATHNLGVSDTHRGLTSMVDKRHGNIMNHECAMYPSVPPGCPPSVICEM